MSTWSKVGEWLKDNAEPGAKLVGSLLTGNAPGAIAAGVSLVSSAAGTDDPREALEQLIASPEVRFKLKELAFHNEADIRAHLAEMHRIDLEDAQKAHEQQQETIRTGDTAEDVYVRRTRPEMARASWKATVAYCLGCWVLSAFGHDVFSAAIAGILISPAGAYMGFRTGDKFAAAIGKRKAS